jgi:hypothetical protein
VTRKEVQSQNTIATGKAVSPVQPEPDDVRTPDYRTDGDAHRQFDRDEATSDSAIAFSGPSDGDHVVSKRDPFALVHLDACLLRIPKAMNLQPQKCYRLGVLVRSIERPFDACSVLARDFDWQEHRYREEIRSPVLKRKYCQPDIEKQQPHELNSIVPSSYSQCETTRLDVLTQNRWSMGDPPRQARVIMLLSKPRLRFQTNPKPLPRHVARTDSARSVGLGVQQASSFRNLAWDTSPE